MEAPKVVQRPAGSKSPTIPIAKAHAEFLRRARLLILGRLILMISTSRSLALAPDVAPDE